MKIDEKLVRYLEELSRLRLSDQEKTETMDTLGRVLQYFEKLEELDTKGVEELSHPFPAVNQFREDKTAGSMGREEILSGAPAQKDGCFQVPKTVE